MKPYLLTPFFCCVFSLSTNAQTLPANNDIAAAEALTVSAGSCGTKTTGTLNGATNSEAGGTPTCGRILRSDVWYTLEVPLSGAFAIETYDVRGTFFESVITVYSGTSDNLIQLTCNDDGGSGRLSKVILTGQTAGATLYIRVWGEQGDRESFEICAWVPANIPANNDIAAAETLTVSADNCNTKTAGTLVDASNSGTGGKPSCGEYWNQDTDDMDPDLDITDSDVWYKLQVPASGALAIETHNVGYTSFDSVLTVYSGTFDNLVEVACDDDGGSKRELSKVELTDQTAGATLYVRVWGYEGDRQPFEICAWDDTPLGTASISSSVFTLYPNPTTDKLYIESSMNVYRVSVYSLSGAEVLKESSLDTANPVMDVSSLSAGVYLMHMEHAEGSDYLKFIKK